MRRIAPVLLATGLAAVSLGCQRAAQQEAAAPVTPAAGPVDAAETTLVTLRVPNMV